MQLKLILTNKTSQEVSESFIEVEEKVIFGRQFSSPILLEGDAISRHHFSIALQEDQPTVENLSSNGTMLNGVPLQGRDTMPLVTGDILEVPGYEIRVEVQSAASGKTGDGASPESGASKGPVWNKVIWTAVEFFDPLEVVLLICAIATIALTTYYLIS